MASIRAGLPALPPPSFPPVSMLPARCLSGAAVVLPDTEVSSWSCDSATPSILERRSSVFGNVLCVDDTRYFWLRRKLRTTGTKGSIQIGFCLKDPGTRELNSSAQGVWEVIVAAQADAGSATGKKDEPQVQMVAIRVENVADFVDSIELAALQFVATLCHGSAGNPHLPHALTIAVDSSQIYIVMPYDYATSISLFDYCLAQPGLVVPETEALGFFRQILQVITNKFQLLTQSLWLLTHFPRRLFRV
jgi:serine/threonine protein kinase